MKRALYLTLVLLMTLNMSSITFANTTIDGNPTSAQTPISYTGDGIESYSITVPASLKPGESGTVTVEGTWAFNKQVDIAVTNKTIILTNDINDLDTKEVIVTFDGISKIGDNTSSIQVSKTISIGQISNALFGTWSGAVEFTAILEDTANLISFTTYTGNYQATNGMTWEQWVSSPYNKSGYRISGNYIWMNNGAMVVDVVSPNELIIDGEIYSMAKI